MKTTLRKRYSSDFKAQIVDLFNLGKTVPQLAEEFGVGTSILYRWLQPASSDQPAQLGSAALRAAPVARRDHPPAHGERHFKKGRCHPRHANPVETRQMILQLQSQTGGSIRQVCQAMGLPRSSFYHAAAATPSHHEDVRMGGLIEEIFKRNRRSYGYRRIRQELGDHDVVCAPSRLRRIMKQRQLRAIQPKNFLPKTSDGRADRPCTNLLAGESLPQKPDQAWAGDITFIPTSTSWLYLAVVIDLGSRRIVGWNLATHMRAELVVHALEQALQARPAARGAIFHSDRGSQYGSGAFRSVLERAGLRQSMSARANPYDNAWTKSFMGTLKREMLQGGCFEDAADARLELFEYIEGYYNHQRKHSALGYLTPNQFETQAHNQPLN